MTEAKFTRRAVPANLIEATPPAGGVGYWLLASPLLLFLAWLWIDLFRLVVGWSNYTLSAMVGLVLYALLIVLPLGYLAHRLVLLLPRLFQHAGWDIEPLEPVKPAELYLVQYRFQARQWAPGGWPRAWLRAAQGWVFLEIAAILVGAIAMIPLFFSAAEFGFGR